MLRRLTWILCLASATTALLAPAAQAVPLLEATSYPASFTGSALNSQVFNTGPAAYKCSGLSLTGTLEKASSTATFAPTYSGCTFWEGGLGAASNGCTFQIHLEKQIEETGTFYTDFQSNLDILCPAGKAIEFSTGANICSWSYGSQTARARIVIENRPESTPDALILYFQVEKLTLTEKSNSWTCGEGHRSSGSIDGAVTLQADTSKGLGQDLWVK